MDSGFDGMVVSAVALAVWLVCAGLWWTLRQRTEPLGRTWPQVVAVALGAIGAAATVLVSLAAYQLFYAPLPTADGTVGIGEIIELACDAFNDTGRPPDGAPMTPSVEHHAIRCAFELSEFDPNPAWWDTNPAWAALGFRRSESHAYSFQFDVTRGETVSFTASAFGDLDCDGQFSTFARFGIVEDGVARPASRAIEFHDELE